jgi:hypothetical protein
MKNFEQRDVIVTYNKRHTLGALGEYSVAVPKRKE